MKSVSLMALLLALSTPAFAQDARDGLNLSTVLEASYAGAQVVDAASDRASKVINPDNSVIGNLEARQRSVSDDIYVKRGVFGMNTFRSDNINAGSVVFDQDGRATNVNVIDGIVDMNRISLGGSTYGRVYITQDAVARNITVQDGAFLVNQIKAH